MKALMIVVMCAAVYGIPYFVVYSVLKLYISGEVVVHFMTWIVLLLLVCTIKWPFTKN